MIIRLHRILVLIMVIACCGAGPADKDPPWKKARDAGSAALDAERFDEAERRFKEAVELTRGSGKEDSHSRNSLHGLACAYEAQKKFSEAVTVRKELLSFAVAARDAATAAQLSSSLNNLANAYRYWGRYDEAGPLYAKGWEILEKYPDADPLSFSVILTNQAKLFRAQGCFADAERNLQRALPYQIKWSGGEKGYVSWVLDEYAELLRVSGREAEAKAMRVRSLKMKVSDNQRYAGEAHARGQVEEARKYERRLEQSKEELAKING